jgi:hypothetical protein
MKAVTHGFMKCRVHALNLRIDRGHGGDIILLLRTSSNKEKAMGKKGKSDIKETRKKAAGTKASAPGKREARGAAPKKQEAKASASQIKKQYLKSGGECKVTFMMPRVAAPEAYRITIVGDFNGWNANATPMKRLRSGDFKATLKLPAGKEYRFRYLIDDSRWENDWGADRYDPNPFASDDSVVCI